MTGAAESGVPGAPAARGATKSHPSRGILLTAGGRAQLEWFALMGLIRDVAPIRKVL
jgi:hypothetical protein